MYVIGKYLNFMSNNGFPVSVIWAWCKPDCSWSKISTVRDTIFASSPGYCCYPVILEPVVFSPFYGQCCLSSDPFCSEYRGLFAIIS